MDDVYHSNIKDLSGQSEAKSFRKAEIFRNFNLKGNFFLMRINAYSKHLLWDWWELNNSKWNEF